MDGAGPRAPTGRPNFLLLMPDQWRHDWTPENPGLAPLLAMPTYMGLVQNGTRFRLPFVPAPLCAPSRACLASGKEYDEAGVPDNFSNDYPLNQTTWMTLLSQVCGWVGVMWGLAVWVLCGCCVAPRAPYKFPHLCLCQGTSVSEASLPESFANVCVHACARTTHGWWVPTPRPGTRPWWLARTTSARRVAWA